MIIVRPNVNDTKPAPAPKATSLNLNKIRLDGGTQSRAGINEDIVDQYANDLLDGAKFPPLIVFYDGNDYWLADGFHRHHAHVRAKLNQISVLVRQGERRDAILYSVGANGKHGLRRSNDDKRRAVMTLLDDPEWSKWSDREIARQCMVGHPLVASIRSSLTGISSSENSERTYTTKHGSVATMNTAAIGKKPAADEPEPEETDDDFEAFYAAVTEGDEPSPPRPAAAQEPGPATGPSYDDLLAAVTLLVGLSVDDINRLCPPNPPSRRTALFQQLSYLIDLFEKVKETAQS